jgi:hypothetical protein
MHWAVQNAGKTCRLCLRITHPPRTVAIIVPDVSCQRQSSRLRQTPRMEAALKRSETCHFKRLTMEWEGDKADNDGTDDHLGIDPPRSPELEPTALTHLPCKLCTCINTCATFHLLIEQ